ncbi:MAG TPA: hypothetical protein VHL31_04900 [Geminicoccus sp.]|jgi:hypothetical protein|uniref:hypothetical protein n=1 Tax=Geminicoccus sp. TaxID=2024832 RepID=UPI002E37B580|nr:hypothetical protein [Geminicoccus sp.]HEX2525625.1 hypothetical protein [Geminicoccus sp.]
MNDNGSAKYPLSKAAVEAAAKARVDEVAALFVARGLQPARPWSTMTHEDHAAERKIAARMLQAALQAWQPSQEQGEVCEREQALSQRDGAGRCIDGMKAAVLTDGS